MPEERFHIEGPEQPQESEDLLLMLLTLPITGVPMFVKWIGEQVDEAVEKELGTEEGVLEQLTQLEYRLDVGEISEEEYMEKEDELMEQLRLIRKRLKAKAGA